MRSSSSFALRSAASATFSAVSACAMATRVTVPSLSCLTRSSRSRPSACPTYAGGERDLLAGTGRADGRDPLVDPLDLDVGDGDRRENIRSAPARALSQCLWRDARGYGARKREGDARASPQRIEKSGRSGGLAHGSPCLAVGERVR